MVKEIDISAINEGKARLYRLLDVEVLGEGSARVEVEVVSSGANMEVGIFELS